MKEKKDQYTGVRIDEYRYQKQQKGIMGRGDAGFSFFSYIVINKKAPQVAFSKKKKSVRENLQFLLSNE